MKADATESANSQANVNHQSHVPTFAKVLDGRKQPIRGLWLRGERYYARLNVEDGSTGRTTTRRVMLVDKEQKPVSTLAQAVAELARLKVKRSDGALPVLRRCPKFSDYADKYLDFISAGAEQKKSGTITKEKSHLKLWKKHLGGVRLDKIKRVHVNDFIEERLKAGMSSRTINLDVISLRCVLKRAIDDGWIMLLPTHGMRPLKVKTVKRSLVTHADIERLCAAAFETRKNEKGETVPVTKNAQEFVDYIKLLAYSGARRDEAIALRWQDVDFEKGQLTIGAEGDTKNSEAQTVDFNPKLKAHLDDMASRLAPDSQWLFPSPQRGQRDIHVQTFRESLTLVRTHAGMPDFNFHDCRHTFISMCVMSGVDYMTIASWVGHKDGGVLIGKVYGHLADEHKKEQAMKVNFEPGVVDDVREAGV